MLTLYDYFRSSASYRVRIALYLKNVPFEVIPVHLLRDGGEQHLPAYDALNPAHLVPCVQVDGAMLSQSLAIIEYLEERYPMPSLWPADLVQKARARAFALAITADLHPLNNLRVLRYLEDVLHASDAQKHAWYAHWVHTGLSALERVLERCDDGHAFAFDDVPGVADLCLIPQLYNARRFSCDLTAYPRLLAVEAACIALPAFEQAYPKEPVA